MSIDRDLRGQNRRADIDQKRNRRQLCQKANNQQSAANDLHYSNEWRRELRCRDSDFDESSHAERVGKEELLNSFREKHPPNQQPHQPSRARGTTFNDPPGLQVAQCSSGYDFIEEGFGTYLFPP